MDSKRQLACESIRRCVIADIAERLRQASNAKAARMLLLFPQDIPLRYRNRPGMKLQSQRQSLIRFAEFQLRNRAEKRFIEFVFSRQPCPGVCQSSKRLAHLRPSRALSQL